MYAKLFSSILDSSVWLQPPTTRLVWLTLLAAKDQDGFARFATVENLAARARVTLKEATIAVGALEGPDADSSNPDHGGRRIERVPGGWMVLNAGLYDAIAKREQEREQIRERVRRHRDKKRGDEPSETTPPASAREAFLSSMRVRAAWEGIIAAAQDGMNGALYKATDAQVEEACREFLTTGQKEPSPRHFLGFLKRAIQGPKPDANGKPDPLDAWAKEAD